MSYIISRILGAMALGGAVGLLGDNNWESTIAAVLLVIGLNLYLLGYKEK